MLVLGIETSTPKVSVALYTEQGLLCEVVVEGKGRQPLLLAVEEAFGLAERKQSELTGVAYSKGPGAFTGLRVGLATAKGIAYALEKPIIGVPTLDAFAGRYACGALVAPLLDAKKGEVYGALYKGEEKVLAEQALVPQAMAEALLAQSQSAALLCIGDGAALVAPYLPGAICLPQLYPSAAEIARQGALALARGEHDDLTAATPTYLRLPEAVVNANQKTKAP